MLQFCYYNGFGIEYNDWTGTTEVTDMGFVMKSFPRSGERKGQEEAEKFIDDLNETNEEFNKELDLILEKLKREEYIN